MISGVGAQFTNTIGMLLACRFLLGAGVGLVMPLSFTLISDYFTGKEQVKMMGYNTAFSNFGGIVTMLLAGYLASFNWRMPFNVYWLGLFIFILVFFFLPKDKPLEGNQEEKAKIPMSIYGLAFAACFIMLIYYAIATNMALYLEQSKLGGSQTAGIVIAFTTVGGIITSMTLVRLEMLLKNYLIPISLLIMGIAFAALTFSFSIPVIMISVCLVGFGQGVIFPLINVNALNQVNPLHSDKVIAIVSSMIYIGQFLSPVVLDGISQLANQPSIRFQYGVIAMSMVVAFVVVFLIKMFQSKQYKQDHA